jgi:hypothetical protein
MAEFGEGFHSPAFGVNRNREAPLGVSDVWQTKGLFPGVLEVWQCLELAGVFSDLWQGKNLGDFRVSIERPVRERCAPLLDKLGARLQLLRELKGPRGGRAPVLKPGCKRCTWLARHGRIAPTQRKHYSILVPYVNDYL